MIKNCTGKNILKVKRVGGDFEIRVVDLSGETLFVEWYQMKKPHKKTYAKVVRILKELEDLIVMEE